MGEEGTVVVAKVAVEMEVVILAAAKGVVVREVAMVVAVWLEVGMVAGKVVAGRAAAAWAMAGRVWAAKARVQ